MCVCFGCAAVVRSCQNEPVPVWCAGYFWRWRLVGGLSFYIQNRIYFRLVTGIEDMRVYLEGNGRVRSVCEMLSMLPRGHVAAGCVNVAVRTRRLPPRREETEIGDTKSLPPLQICEQLLGAHSPHVIG